jgi:hypothetical protein
MSATAAFHEEATRRGSDLFPVVTVHWPAWMGTKSYGTADYIAAGIAVSARVQTLSAVKSAIASRPTDLQAQVLDVTLVDRNQELTRIIKGQTNPRRSRVTLRIGSRRLGVGDWYMRFDGILVDWEWNGTTVTLHCKTDDRVLLGRVPKPQLTKGAFPGAPNESLGLYLPVILGIHDSQALSGTGMVQAICISLDAGYGYRYAPTFGRARAVPRVYKNGNLQALGTDYTISYPVLGGLQLTSIDFTSATVANDVITCDIEGLTTDGTTAGQVILNPADQMRWVLVNLVWGDWRTGAYLPDSSAPIASSAWAAAATYMGAFGDEGAMRLGGDTDRDSKRAQDVFNEWLRSEPLVRGGWTSEGKLAVVPFSHLPPSNYMTAAVIDAYVDTLERQPYTESDSGLVSKVSINHLFGGGKFNATVEIQDYFAWAQEQVTETIDMPYSSARFQ